MREEFDYVIVGAGSAGCVLADRLSEDGNPRVLVLEYGGSDRSIFIQMPTALSIPMNMPRYNWCYHTEPEPHLDGRRMHTPRGKVLGGSSSINGLVYIRGNPLDFERWGTRARRAGATPTCCRTSGAPSAATRAATNTAATRARSQTAYGTLANPLHAAWLEAARQAGYPLTRTSTAPAGGLRPHGHDGRRRPPLQCRPRLPAARRMRRPNLAVRTHALATRIDFRGRRRDGRALPAGRQDARACARAAK